LWRRRVADKVNAMLYSPLFLTCFFVAAAALAWWRTGIERQSGQTWESLIGRLKDCHGRELSPQFLWREGLSMGPDETWHRLGGPRGLWSLYRNACVMMEMAEFAARHTGVEPEIVEALRCNAMQIRLYVVTALVQCVLQQANDGVQVQAFRAASVYTGMAARMADLLRTHALVELPQFVAAM